jgi:hypothetical protein
VLSHHVFRHSRLGNFITEHQELAVDPGRAPEWVLPAHPPDQIPQSLLGRPALPRDFRAKSAETGSVPAQDRLELDYLEGPKQLGSKPSHPRCHGRCKRAGARRNATELVPPREIFNFEPSPRLEQVEDEDSEGV